MPEDSPRRITTIDEDAVLDRIHALNDTLHAVIAVDPFPVVKRIDAPGRLSGIPLLTKDNIQMGGLPTTAGSVVLAEHHSSSHDAPAVAALRRAGAVLVGKANLSEWANFRSTHSTSGWSAAGGLTANPYALNRSAGGSSSGSAAAVAAGIVQGALGTETDGSIICPASLCGCVGLKPTHGKVSTEGVVPIAASHDVVGPITRTVNLAPAMFDVLTGLDTERSLEKGVRGLRIGVPQTLGWGRRQDLDGLCERTLLSLSTNGATIIDGIEGPEEGDLDEEEMTVLLAEFHHGINAYLAQYGDRELQTLHDLIALNRESPSELKYFGIELFEMARDAPDVTSDIYASALTHIRRKGREEGIDKMLAFQMCDALILPSFDPAWKSDLVHGDPPGLYSPSQLPAIAGYPAITVPIGLVGGLPAGIMVIGTAHAEETLLRIASCIEHTCDPLPMPEFREPAAG